MALKKDCCARCGAEILPGHGRKIGRDRRICRTCDYVIDMTRKRTDEYMQAVASILYPLS